MDITGPIGPSSAVRVLTVGIVAIGSKVVVVDGGRVKSTSGVNGYSPSSGAAYEEDREERKGGKGR